MKRFNKLVLCLWLCVPLSAVFMLWWIKPTTKPDIFDTVAGKVKETHKTVAKQKPQQQLTYWQIRQFPISYQSDEIRLSNVENRLDDLEWENQQLQSQLSNLKSMVNDLFRDYRERQNDQFYRKLGYRPVKIGEDIYWLPPK